MTLTVDQTAPHPYDPSLHASDDGQRWVGSRSIHSGSCPVMGLATIIEDYACDGGSVSVWGCHITREGYGEPFLVEAGSLAGGTHEVSTAFDAALALIRAYGGLPRSVGVDVPRKID